MINKFLNILLILLVTSNDVSNIKYTKGAVVLAGSCVSSRHTVDTKKYKRKDCPVCKGKGWYISGDGISRVNCGYCEPETEQTGIIKNKEKKL